MCPFGMHASHGQFRALKASDGIRRPPSGTGSRELEGRLEQDDKSYSEWRTIAIGNCYKLRSSIVSISRAKREAEFLEAALK